MAGPAAHHDPLESRPPTSFVGRADEVAEIAELLAARRLVTLTGAGGIGKTRLALEVTNRVRADFEDGVWFVDLAPLAEPGLVARAVAAALDVRDASSRPPLEALVDALRRKRALLVLDNCEHLVDACAEILAALLGACFRLRVLATSREPVGIVGEQVRSLGPLDGPDAVRLFAERAAPRFGEGDPELVAEICQKVEGIPLALELVAASAAVTPLDRLAASLSESMLAFESDDRVSGAHHETLRATIDWSYVALDADERAVFDRLSVFADGGTLWAVGAVCKGGIFSQEAVLPTLTRLVDKSLVTTVERGDDVRYRLLEPVRQYAAERLSASGDEGTVRDLHRDWFLRFAEQNERLVWKEPRQNRYLERIDGEIGNLRAALRWSRHRGDAEALLETATALGQYWVSRGYWAEGRAWLEEGLASIGSAAPPVRARALHAVGFIVHWQGEAELSREYLEESVRLRREQGDGVEIAMGLRLLANVLTSHGEHELAEAHLVESLELFRAAGHTAGLAAAALNLGLLALLWGDRARGVEFVEEALEGFRAVGHTMGIAASLQNLGEYAAFVGDAETAARHLEESLAIAREIGDRRHEAHAVRFLGHVAMLRGALGEARERFVEAMTLDRDLGHTQGTVLSLEAFARLAALRGDAAGALRLAGAAEALRESIQLPVSTAERAALDEWLAVAHATLGPQASSEAMAEGRRTPVDDAVREAMG